jgi:hypothetical protein
MIGIQTDYKKSAPGYEEVAIIGLQKWKGCTSV